ncbi:MAG: GNAT family N-acetyltransferase [Leeuwenhoekiella sp.]|nr:MAG: GNAT family N-acetyltransferase [Leeuwenhoekiella sp.]
MHHWIDPQLELVNERVKLIPLSLKHRDGLLEAASDGKLWELWYTSVPDASKIDDYIKLALDEQSKGLAKPFTVVDVKTGKIIGSTRFCKLQPQHRRLEIGYTWYAKRYQRTSVNTHCKLLLLQYAFDNLDCIAVQFMTDWFNLNSREAIARLGAKQDGILRHHRLNKDGSYRDSVVFSITNKEWSGVQKNLQLKLHSYNP